jgi:hypothetical protein
LVAVPEDTTEVQHVSNERSEHSGHIPIEEKALLGMKCAVIVVELQKRGQVVGGTKPILLDRLRSAIKEQNTSRKEARY